MNTLTWAILLGICIFGIIKLLKALDIRIDARFIFSLIPYIFVGSTLRVIEDANLVSPPLSYLLITPLIYFLMFFAVLMILLVSIRLARFMPDAGYHLPLGSAGTLWTILNLWILIHSGGILNPWVLPCLLIITLSTIAPLYLILRASDRIIKPTWENMAILTAHILDASSTFIGVDLLSYQGKHVLERFIVEHTHTALPMIPLKLIILLPLLYLLERELSEEAERDLRGILILTLIVIGLGPAIRNTTRMILGV